jgi:soluble lytic murein transglycosylase-like protein
MNTKSKAVVAVLGLAVLGAAPVIPSQPEEALGPGLPAFVADPFGLENAGAGPTTAAAAIETALEREQRALTEYIARRYRIAEAAAHHFVLIAYRAGEQHRVDPVLILAVMAIESRYNPVAESVVGAKGLMQVIAKYHQEKLFDHGGEHALLDPEVNIHVGAQILREYQRRFQDLETALQVYAGAFDEPTSRYANKVFDEKSRLDIIRWKARKQTGQSA